MKELEYGAAVIGGGSAGLAAAVEIARRGYRVALIERELHLGGILNQCIHNGFGLHYFREELTGPEYAERFIDLAGRESGIDFYTDTAVLDVRDEGSRKLIFGISRESGVTRFVCGAVVLAMGCRERNRGNIGIPGTRPAGVFTAGLAQRLVNVDGYVPGREVVIVGSGDIGLIMARRMTWVGAKVHAVVEIQPYPSGLTRNIAQCLNDFSIPLYLSHVVSEIHGADRVEGVTITPIENHEHAYSKSFRIDCDTVLLSVGLVPDNELSKKFGVELSPETNGPYVDSRLMTSCDGVFACGNVLHVHDLVDYVTEEASRCGRFVADYLQKSPVGPQLPALPGANVKYVTPNRCEPGRDNHFYLRSLIVKNNATLRATIDGRELLVMRLAHVQPSEMISVILDAHRFGGLPTVASPAAASPAAASPGAASGRLEISIE